MRGSADIIKIKTTGHFACDHVDARVVQVHASLAHCALGPLNCNKDIPSNFFNIRLTFFLTVGSKTHNTGNCDVTKGTAIFWPVVLIPLMHLSSIKKYPFQQEATNRLNVAFS